ncbi:MAG: putative toxin-antitoxin system toxin component, PIN family [Bacteroidaceae bacterium]|nr:putative toxin-antitoxin system toxin component, PIN family [Bacteroidaceae bacterium]
MRQVVLDTNALIQSLPSRSRYHQIWTDFLEGRYRLCVSNEILSEYEEILARYASPEVAHNVVEAIARHPQTLYRESYYRFHLLSDIDKDDDKYVDCAITAGADYIVTEDSHFNHLKEIPFPRLNILTLDEFYETLKRGSTHYDGN